MLNVERLVCATLLGFALGQNFKLKKKLTQAEHQCCVYLTAFKAQGETELKLNRLIDYLCDVIEKNGVEADEFDMIALDLMAD